MAAHTWVREADDGLCRRDFYPGGFSHVGREEGSSLYRQDILAEQVLIVSHFGVVWLSS